jgi:hypothetical protein
VTTTFPFPEVSTAPGRPTSRSPSATTALAGRGSNVAFPAARRRNDPAGESDFAAGVWAATGMAKANPRQTTIRERTGTGMAAGSGRCTVIIRDDAPGAKGV